MCLAIPARIIRIESPTEATVELGGVRKRISVELIEDPRVDDFVIVHVGFALSKINAAEAARTLEAMRDAGVHLEAGA